MDFQQRLRRALEVKSVHQALSRLESAIDRGLDRLQVVESALSDSERVDPPYQVGPPRTREQIAISENIRGALQSVQNRNRHPDIKRWEQKGRLARARRLFLDSIDVPDEQIDFSTVSILLPVVNRLELAREKFLSSLENAKTT